MVIQVKENFEKTRHVENNDQSKKISFGEKKLQDILIEF